MSVITRSALEASPLADLHAIASELGLDGFRRLRKADLVDAILERQGANGDEPAPARRSRRSRRDADATPADEKPARRARRGGRGRGRARDRDPGDIDVGEEDAADDAAEATAEPAAARAAAQPRAR